MADSQNHYDVLGIRPTADLDAIKRAYRAQIRKHHPDQFVSELARLREQGFTIALEALEDKIDSAKKQTQRINAAYAVLSDAKQREHYDRTLYAQRPYYSTPPDSRTSTRPRPSQTYRSPHPHPNVQQNESPPWVLIVGFFVILTFTMGLLSNFLGTRQPVVVTPAGLTMMDYLQATANANQATAVARTQAANAPTMTPRSPELNESAGDNLFQDGTYELALEMYDEVLEQQESASVFYKRGLTYAELDDRTAALRDFDQAIALDPDMPEVYRARGLALYERWRENAAPADAAAALDDFERFAELGGDTDDPEIATARTALTAEE